MRESRYIDALEQARAALALSGAPRMWWHVGVACAYLHRDEEAIRAFERYIAAAPAGAHQPRVYARVALLRCAVAAKASVDAARAIAEGERSRGDDVHYWDRAHGRFDPVNPLLDRFHVEAVDSPALETLAAVRAALNVPWGHDIIEAARREAGRANALQAAFDRSKSLIQETREALGLAQDEGLAARARELRAERDDLARSLADAMALQKRSAERFAALLKSKACSHFPSCASVAACAEEAQRRMPAGEGG